MYDLILIRFGELSLKGKNKMHFVKQLAYNISQICQLEYRLLQIEIDRIFIPYQEQFLKQLQFVFGVSSFSPVYAVASDLEVMQAAILKHLPTGQSFKVNARRHWKQFGQTSIELNAQIGAWIAQQTNLKVLLNQPEIEIQLEVHQQKTYIFFNKIAGLGGLPVGISGQVVHLISGGIDSPVAAYQLMKRGVKVHFLAFISPPHTDQTTVNKLHQIVQLLNQYQPQATLYLCNYTEIMNYLALTSNQAYKIVLMRRSFYRMANVLANQLEALAIANGENLGQVASQTMAAMQVIHDASALPVFQPLLTNDKLETIKLAEQIGTFAISTIKACETCELFAPEQPSTKPNLALSQKLEAELPLLSRLEMQALENKTTVVHFVYPNKTQ